MNTTLGVAAQSEIITTTISGDGWTIVRRYECVNSIISNSGRLIGSGGVGETTGVTCTLLESQIQQNIMGSTSALFSRFLELLQSHSSSVVTTVSKKVQELGNATSTRLLGFSQSVFSHSLAPLEQVSTAPVKTACDLVATCSIEPFASNISPALTLSQKMGQMWNATSAKLGNFSTTFITPNIGMVASELVVDGMCKVYERKMNVCIPFHVRVALKVGAVGSVGYMTGAPVIPYATGRIISIVIPKLIKRVFR